MFVIDKWYVITMMEGGETVRYASAKVVEISMPLVTFQSSAIGGGGQVIVNTASLAFVKAEPADG